MRIRITQMIIRVKQVKIRIRQVRIRITHVRNRCTQVRIGSLNRDQAGEDQIKIKQLSIRIK